MATNATVEKLQAVAVRHGEKAVVTLAVVLFFLFVFKAITREAPITFGPEALQKKAEAADTNLSRRQEPNEILRTLVDQGLKPETDFDKTVADQQQHQLNPADFAFKQKWVTPEPGAGLIRDQPELIAPEDLYAYPNRGGYRLFALDDKGERIVDTGKDKEKKKSGITPPRRRRGMGFGGMAMSGSGSSMPGSGGSAKSKEEEEKKRLEEERLRRAALAGNAKEAGAALPKEESKAAAEPEANVTYKEVVKGLRSVVITGTIDNKRLRENYLSALKSEAIAYPNYKRLDVQRQTLGPDGQWSDFADVDGDANYKVLDNLTETDEEYAPDDVRLEALVDPLPFAVAGYWQGVHVASLVPKEKVNVEKPAAAGFAGSGGSGSYMAQMQMMQQQQMQQQQAASRMGSSSMSSMMGSGSMMMGRPGMAGMPGMPGAAGAGGPTDDMDFEKSEADRIMIRSIDFTVEPEATYRYRVRIVVYNPNKGRNDVNPGVDTESDELKGPWSDPTDDVTVPADVATYAMRKAAATGRRDDQVTFQVVRWDPASGHTITRDDDAGPGEIIGQPLSAQVPSSEGDGAKMQSIDFNSHRVVVDTMGGLMPAPKPIGASAPFDEPTLALTLRPDGSVALRSQPQDVTDPVREQMAKDYKRALDDSSKKRSRRSNMSMMGSGSGMSR